MLTLFVLSRRQKNSLKMRHFNHLDGRLVVSTLASECKASACNNTTDVEREREREKVRLWGEEVMMDRRRRYLSSHLWRERAPSHFTVVPGRPAFICLTRKHKLPDNFICLISAAHSQLSTYWRRHYGEHKGAPSNKTWMPFRTITQTSGSDWVEEARLKLWPVGAKGRRRRESLVTSNDCAEAAIVVYQRGRDRIDKTAARLLHRFLLSSLRLDDCGVSIAAFLALRIISRRA